MLHYELMDLIMDHYENPRNAGEMADPDVKQTANNPGCGDKITVYLKIKEGKVKDIKFEIEGCIVSQAGTSIISEFVKDRPVEEIKNTGSAKIREIMGKDFVIRRPQCTNLGINTINAAIIKYENQQNFD